MKPPAFQFYADDFLGGVADMTQAEVGAFMLLLCYQWNRGEIPSDPARAALIAKGEVTPHVLAKFPDGKNPRLEIEREKQAEFRRKCSEAGRRSVEGRLEGRLKVGSTDPEGTFEGRGEGQGNSPLSTLQSPSPSIEHIAAAPRVRAKFEPPSIEAVKLHAAKVGLPPAEAEKFFNYYTANGWRVGRNPMKSWPHALANWKNNATGYAPQAAASNADRVLWSRERQAIAERLKAIKQQASQSADGTLFLSEAQKAERKRLKERDAELMAKLGQAL